MGGPNSCPTNPGWRTASILKKTVKSPYLSNRLIDFDEIWQAGADWPHTGGRSLKFPIIQKNKIVAAAILKCHKNRDIIAMD